RSLGCSNTARRRGRWADGAGTMSAANAPTARSRTIWTPSTGACCSRAGCRMRLARCRGVSRPTGVDAMLAQGLKRVRYKLQQRRGERLCRAQGDPLAGSTGLIVTTFYDVEGNYAMPGTTPVSIETVGRILEIEKRC